MKKSILSAICFAIALPICYSQEEEPQMEKTRRFEHQVGVQANGLIRQIFNFSNSNNTIDNPYLLIYSINFAKSGWGLRVGGGYNNSFQADNDGIVEHESTITNTNVRLGVEKSFRLSNKWTTGVGIDAIYGNDNDKTKAITRFFDTSTVQSKTTIQVYGGGAMAWLRYHLTDNILIGTETSFYQRIGNQSLDLTITQRNNALSSRPIVTTTSKQDHKLNEGVINLPVAIYLIVKF